MNEDAETVKKAIVIVLKWTATLLKTIIRGIARLLQAWFEFVIMVFEKIAKKIKKIEKRK